MPLKILHILPPLLPFAELLLRGEEIFLGCDALEEVAVYLHSCILLISLSISRPAESLTEYDFSYKYIKVFFQSIVKV